jgi:hypothetical protein
LKPHFEAKENFAMIAELFIYAALFCAFLLALAAAAALVERIRKANR